MGDKILSYSELLKLDSYGDRLDYLFLGDNNLTSPRDISNSFYKSKAWLSLREEIILRDMLCDLGVPGMELEKGDLIIHHINPITRLDLLEYNEDILLNPDNLILVSYATHNKIHYSRVSPVDHIERLPGDTKLW